MKKLQGELRNVLPCNAEFLGNLKRGLASYAACNYLGSLFMRELYNSLIRLLLGFRSPAYISGLVVTVIVNPVKRMARGWPRPDNAIKFLKAGKTKADSSASILGKLLVISPKAAIFSIVPGIMFWCVAHPVSQILQWLDAYRMSIQKAHRLPCHMSDGCSGLLGESCRLSASAFA